MPHGIYIRALHDSPGEQWVRSRRLRFEGGDPIDHFRAFERNCIVRRTPGHISWNVWLDGAWRQMAIVQGEGVEPSEVSPAA